MNDRILVHVDGDLLAEEDGARAMLTLASELHDALSESFEVGLLHCDTDWFLQFVPVRTAGAREPDDLLIREFPD